MTGFTPSAPHNTPSLAILPGRAQAGGFESERSEQPKKHARASDARKRQGGMDVQWRQEIPEDMRKQMITEMYVYWPHVRSFSAFSVVRLKRKATREGAGAVIFLTVALATLRTHLLMNVWDVLYICACVHMHKSLQVP